MTPARWLMPVLLLLSAADAGAQQSGSGFELTVANIMRGPELVGTEPDQVRWTPDGEWIYFRWKPGGLDWYTPPSLYRVRHSGGEPERLTGAVADSLGVLVAAGDVSADERRKVVAHDGDLYIIDRRTLARRRLTHTPAAESSPVFAEGDRRIYFLRTDNLFALDLESAEVVQLTDVRRGSPPEETVAEGQRGYLEQQQRELFETIRIRERLDEQREEERQRREDLEVRPLYIEERERLDELAVEPRGRHAVVVVTKPPQEEEVAIVPEWVTESGYVETRDTRAKVGDLQGESRLAVLDLEQDTARWIDLSPGHEEADSADAGTERFAAIRFLGWNDAGTHGLVGAVSFDYKDQWLHALDAATGQLLLIAHDRDDAWIGGPCGPWAFGCAGWVPGDDAVWFVSERDGYSHLYRVEGDGSNERQLTRGEWEVLSVEIAPDDRRFYLTTSEVSPFERHFYHMPLEGGARVRITTPAGGHWVTPSPAGERLALVHSRSNEPPELHVMANRAGAEMRRLTTTPIAEWRSHDWIAPEIVRVPARDGTPVPARIYRPRDVGAQANGAAVIFVHGAGYLHNVHDWWSTYYREYMFHHLLAQRGYTVLDMDYRGSAGYGRDWRTAVYRHMGGTDLTDHIDGAHWLVQQGYATDAERVGIYGGSYGGFITLMALFTAPESFGAGAALRSVTDWAHYNHWYTSRILNLPHEDVEAYQRSSPIYFAEGLADPLLIAHGMRDVNVHFQDVVRLAQRLIELGKTDWELAVYPVEDHAFVEPSSWTDEYRRILELFERHLANRNRTADAQ
ncbi:MAG: prolyl oligopeptidase family serine peptidase [Longimicrobiales bacterium]